MNERGNEHLGVTGTRAGMTATQITSFLKFLEANTQYGTLHHGDCIGADFDAVVIARIFNMQVVCHPPIDSKYRAWTLSDQVKEPRSYLRRNHDIVNASDVMVAFPKTNNEVLRSGTWATIRYARKQGKMPHIFLPPQPARAQTRFQQ